MTENEFLLHDRITKIKSINEQHDLEHNAYVSFSGGKDSTVLHYLIDEALPNNRIPRVFLNTGIEYKAILKFVREMAEKDDRFVIYNVGKNIPETLRAVGYPFKSKEHSHKLHEWQNGSRGKSLRKYFRQEDNGFQSCPQKLMYQIEDGFELNVSDFCCYEFKKKPAVKYQKQSGRNITITGMMKEEGGQRTTLNCIVTDSKSGKVKKFHPMAVLSSDFENWYIKENDIKLCELYYPPYNFERTGCKGCPYNLYLQKSLDTMERLLPQEKKQCEMIWKPVYAEYRRIGYRLKKNEVSLFD